MRRTREIKGWIFNESTTLHERFPDNFDSMEGVSRATLIIKLPERKVTISESDFMDSVTKYCHQNPSVKSLNEMMKMFKDDLFKDS